MTQDEKEIVTRAIFAITIGLAIIGAGGVAAVRLVPVKVAQITPYINNGDTPVVLVGGSMIFKSNFNRTAQDWAPVGTDGKEYQVSAAYQITAIAIKSGAPNNDSDGPSPSDGLASNDKLFIDVTNAVPWQIDEFTVASPSTAVTSVFSKQNGANTEIHVRLNDPNGLLCPVGGKYRRLAYSPTKSCPATGLPGSVNFSQISVTVNGDAQPSGTLSCIDSNGDGPGRCRIALRGTP
jgi:hypothetical protein